ncbi:MAG: hypothetical protein II349_02310 [Akkermansia sp.]|nr:hypothetical protein [Akkermansia sp.]
MRYGSRTVTIVRCVLFALLGVLFINHANGMESSTAQTIFYIFGVLDLAWAGWILFSYIRQRKG